MRRSIGGLGGLLTGLVLLWSLSASAASHALLMGVGHYPKLKQKAQLEGPPNDVRVLADLLAGRYGFPRANITTLLDGQVTRKAIMAALEGLERRTDPGDFILIYFSGHGTSTYENRQWGFDASTGAICPADLDLDAGMDQMMATVVVGTRDLRPALQRLERKDRYILAAFDACYSGYAIRSLFQNGVPKYLPLPLEDLTDEEKPGEYGTNTRKRPPYPYRNVVYISAASVEERAFDINRATIRQGIGTVDGKPHGAMTDALIRGLQGEADADGDGGLTATELYGYIRTTVEKRFPQTPQLLYAETSNQGIVDQPLLRTRSAAPPPSDPPKPPPAEGGPLRVKVERVSAALQSRIEAVPGVKVTKGDFDILATTDTAGRRTVRRKRDLFLYLPNGALLFGGDEATALAALGRQARVRELIAFAYPKQDFNVFVELLESKGVLVEGDPVGFTIRAEADAYILLLNVDPAGMVNVIYPFYPRELKPLAAKKPLNLPDIGEVTAPNYGTEHIKVFAFRKKPGALGRIMGKEFSPEDPLLDTLMEMVRGDGRAQMTIQVKTAPKKDVVWTQ